MIKHLSIKNYALIRELELNLHDGLSVITGETGSGKSILLGALGLVLGDRADIKSLAQSDSKCVVEATVMTHEGFKGFFDTHDLDYQKESILRREISPSGKSRSFINDTPVNLNQLKNLGSQLVEIHSQDQNSVLNSSAYRFEILDSFAGIHQDRIAFTGLYQEYKDLQKTLTELKEREHAAKSDLDYFSFQLRELEESNLEYINKEDLEQELKSMNHAEEIGQLMNDLDRAVHTQDNSIYSQLNTLIYSLEKKADIHPNFGEYKERLQSVLVELEDLASDAQQVSSSLDMDPGRLEQITSILNQLYNLESKHQVASTQELIEVRDSLKNRIQNVSGMDEQIEQIERQLKTLTSKLDMASNELREKRIASASSLRERIESLFKRLGLNHALFQVVLEESEDFNSFGKDFIRFEFCANPGSFFQPVEKVASGGEKSRLMLALKAISAAMTRFPTLILDEIDTGVSGEIARKMGEVMLEMSENTQVVSITHLAQIAGLGQHHYKVQKEVEGEETKTYIHELNQEERVVELAEILSGKELGEAALENARTLLKQP